MQKVFAFRLPDVSIGHPNAFYSWVNSHINPSTPVKETNILEIEYRLTSESSLPLIKNDTHYELYLDIYKQPGSKDDSYSLSLSYPKDWDLEIYKGLTNIENNLNSRFELSSDKNFFISWIR